MANNSREQLLIHYSNKTDEVLQTLPAFVKDFIDDCREKNRSARTIYGYVIDIRTFFVLLTQENPALKGDIRNVTLEVLEHLQYKDLKEYILDVGVYNIDGQTRVNKEYAKNRKVSSLRSFYNYLYAAGDISNNPASILKGPKINGKEPVTLSRKESDTLLSSIENQAGITNNLQALRSEKSKYRDKAIALMLLGTGIRVSELVGISLKDFNWSENGVRVIRKGGSEQTVYFDQNVRDAIFDYIKYERISPDGDDTDALFVSRNKQRMTVRSVERMIKKYTQISVPDKTITPHKLRASYGTNLMDATHDANLVADALGHSNLATVKKYMGHSDKNRRQAREAVDWTNNNSEEQLEH